MFHLPRQRRIRKHPRTIAITTATATVAVSRLPKVLFLAGVAICVATEWTYPTDGSSSSMSLWTRIHAAAAAATTTTTEFKYDWTSLSPLPSPRSDLTATLVVSPSRGDYHDRISEASFDGLSSNKQHRPVKVYLLGGCASGYREKQTVRWKTSDGQYHLCTNVSGSAWSYDPSLDSYETSLARMPHPRHRHTATLVWDDKIWVLGGRDRNDDVVDAVDVYYIASNTWETIGTIPDPTSDHGAFFVDNDDFTGLCTVGGWDQNYELRKTTTCIDIVQTSIDFIIGRCGNDCVSVYDPEDSIVPPPPSDPRADVYASMYHDQQVYIVGGVQRQNRKKSCKSTLDSVEVYQVQDNRWSFSPDLPSARSGVHTVILGDSLFAIGGEFNSDCESMTSMAHDDVEVLHLSDQDAGVNTSWKDVPSLPRPLSRLAAVADPFGGRDSVYVFGGRGNPDAECDCYPILDGAMALTMTEVLTTSSPTAVPSPGGGGNGGNGNDGEGTTTASPPTMSPSVVGEGNETAPSEPNRGSTPMPTLPFASGSGSPSPSASSSSSASGSGSSSGSGSMSPGSGNITSGDTASVVFSALMDREEEVYASDFRRGNEPALFQLFLDSVNRILCEDTDFYIVSGSEDDDGRNPQAQAKSQMYVCSKFRSNNHNRRMSGERGRNILAVPVNETVLHLDPNDVSIRDREGTVSGPPDASYVEWLAWTIRYRILGLHEAEARQFTSASDVQMEARAAVEKRIEDGTLLQMLQEQDPRVLSVANRGNETVAFEYYAIPERVPGGYYDPLNSPIMHPVRIVGVVLLLWTLVFTTIMVYYAKERAKTRDAEMFAEDQYLTGNLCTNEGVNEMLDVPIEAESLRQPSSASGD